MESSLPTPGSVNPQEILGRWLDEIASGQRELHAVLEETFGQIVAAIEDWQRLQAVAEQRLHQREEELRRRQEELEQALAQHQQAQTALTQLREQIDFRAAELEHRARQLEVREAELQQRLAEAGEHRQELEVLRQMVAELRSLQSVPLAPHQAGDHAVPHEELIRWQQKAAELEKERDTLQREKELLETEVHVLRHRAMEWLEMLADQRRQLLDERSRWAGELRQFRRLIEVLLDRQLEPLPEVHEDDTSGTPRVIAYEPVEARKTGTGDAFLDSLSAQFEQLRREFERRRGQERS